MKTVRALLIVALTCVMMGATGQTTTLELTFTAVDNTAHVQLDSIKIMNRTQGGEIMVYWPDTTVTIDITPGDLLLYIGYSTGIPVGVPPGEQDIQKFYLSQSYPNPVFEQCHISMSIPEPGNVNILASDIRGTIVHSTERFMRKGNHSFRFIPGGAPVYILKARWNNLERTIKIINANPGSGKNCQLDYAGIENGDYSLKISPISSDLVMKESGILDSPDTNKSYTFQFATNIPCLGTPTVEYEGQVYNTIQIFSQCWLKENLNVGTMIQGSEEMTDNGILEKYCYNNDTSKCSVWGGLYQWNEMMQYANQPGAQGICPPGWHVPTDEDWNVLEGAIDGQYKIGDSEWDWWDFRGSDIGIKIKSTTGWDTGCGNGTDTHGFKLMPGGLRYFNDGKFYHAGCHANLWSSNSHTDYYKWFRFIIGYIIESYRNSTPLEGGYSVRCIQN